MLVRVEPAGGGPLAGSKIHAAGGAWRNDPLWTAVDLTRHLQPMPVNGRLFGQAVVNIHGHRLPFFELQRRPQQIAVITPGGRLMRTKLRFSGLDR